ncbi:unnamed protein product [Taenia asiatica]|uniref:EF-hand domain-containing protein n=1 Tax=Taenia asiatica TaxID=60517 RepID=A0A3P6RMU1_TAEAS|nr:unnamed protein product [Taenia asiatica]
MPQGGTALNFTSMAINVNSLIHLVILVLLLSLLPTAKAFGLGHFHQQRNPTLHRPASPPLYDLERATDGTLTEDSTVKIRTREVENHPPPPPLPSIPLQQVENPVAEPWLYNVPPVDPNLQRAAAFTPVFVPNYNYYAFGTPWSYPETRLVGAYAPAASPVSQWNPQAHYYYSRNPAQYRRKPGDKKRRDKYKGEKCQKICETCLRNYDGADVDIDKERAILQQRFALHIKPSMKHKESVEALFKYMDGNSEFISSNFSPSVFNLAPGLSHLQRPTPSASLNFVSFLCVLDDGAISFTELQNYLLLHNIISPEVPQ